MSEKMDGVRAYWNGKELISRNGNSINSPSWFMEPIIPKLPNGMTLDGELWMGRGTSHSLVSGILLSTNGDWSQVEYHIFDIPSCNGCYEIRMEQMELTKGFLPSHMHIVENIRCKGLDHLQEYLDSIVGTQGEGVMLRQPHTENVLGYTPSLLKVKV